MAPVPEPPVVARVIGVPVNPVRDVLAMARAAWSAAVKVKATGSDETGP